MKFTATIAIAITMGVAPVFAQPVRGGGFEVSTLDDPGAYTKPWNGGFNLRWNPGAEMFEHVCQDNNKVEEMKDGAGGAARRRSMIVL